MDKELNILVLSSRDPSYSAHLGQDVVDSLKGAGHKVTYNFEGSEDFITQITKKKSYLEKKTSSYIYKILNYIKKTQYLKSGIIKSNGFIFFMGDESKEKIHTPVILERTKQKHDIIVCLFFQGMLSIDLMHKLWQVHHCPILIYSVDMYPMTGGCYYFKNCRNFTNNCEDCPAFFGKKKSIASSNFAYKKDIYKNDYICFLGNSWMNNFARSAKIFPEDQIFTFSFILNENYFKPIDIQNCRRELNIPEGKQKIILIRYQKQSRKGCSIAIDAISRYLKDCNENEKKETLLLTIGEFFTANMGVDVMNLGFVDSDTLVKVYNVSTVFLCPSIDDAGPSMVNQSIACGTPVVAFDSGTAQDVITTNVSGYKAKFNDLDDYYRGIRQLLKMPTDEYAELRSTTRKTAIEWNSLGIFAKKVEDIYNNWLKKNI